MSGVNEACGQDILAAEGNVATLEKTPSGKCTVGQAVRGESVGVNYLDRALARVFTVPKAVPACHRVLPSRTGRSDRGRARTSLASMRRPVRPL